jgi:hypothetical protein
VRQGHNKHSAAGKRLTAAAPILLLALLCHLALPLLHLFDAGGHCCHAHEQAADPAQAGLDLGGQHDPAACQLCQAIALSHYSSPATASWQLIPPAIFELIEVHSARELTQQAAVFPHVARGPPAVQTA